MPAGFAVPRERVATRLRIAPANDRRDAVGCYPEPRARTLRGELGRVGENWGELGRLGASWGELGRVGENWGELGRIGENSQARIHNLHA
eukprot:5856202-Pyramimonas_sp.AAC.2